MPSDQVWNASRPSSFSKFTFMRSSLSSVVSVLLRKTAKNIRFSAGNSSVVAFAVWPSAFSFGAAA